MPQEGQAVVAGDGAPTYQMKDADREVVLGHGGTFARLDPHVRRRLQMALNRTCTGHVQLRWSAAKNDRSGARQLHFLKEWAKDPSCSFCAIGHPLFRKTTQKARGCWGCLSKDQLLWYFKNDAALVSRIMARTRRKRGADPEQDLYWVWLAEGMPSSSKDVPSVAAGKPPKRKAGSGDEKPNAVAAGKPPKRKAGPGDGQRSKKPNPGEARQGLQKRRKQATNVLASICALQQQSLGPTDSLQALLAKEAQTLADARGQADQAARAWDRCNIGDEDLQRADKELQQALEHAGGVIAQGQQQAGQLMEVPH